MTEERRAELRERLRELQNDDEWDKGVAHGEADEVLCEVLTELGCEDIVAEWRRVPKWYS